MDDHSMAPVEKPVTPRCLGLPVEVWHQVLVLGPKFLGHPSCTHFCTFAKSSPSSVRVPSCFPDMTASLRVFVSRTYSPYPVSSSVSGWEVADVGSRLRASARTFFPGLVFDDVIVCAEQLGPSLDSRSSHHGYWPVWMKKSHKRLMVRHQCESIAE